MSGGASAVLALAAVAIALALQISSGMYDARALALVTLASVAAAIGSFWRRRAPAPEVPLLAQAILGAGCTAGLLCHLFLNPTFYADARAFEGGFRWFALISLVILSAYLCIHLRASLIRARFLLLLLCFAVMGIVVLRASPRPWVDVWTFQQGAADALLHGVNPYAASYPDIYGGGAPTPFYARELLHGGRVAAFPYTPLTILADVPGVALFGDFRYSMLALMIGSAWLIARAAPGVTGELAGLLLLLQPRTLFVLEQGWTEPLVIFCFALTVYGLSRGRHPLACGAALGLLAASKQYSPFLVAPLLLLFGRGRGLWVASAVLLLMLLPFAIPDPAGFWRGVVRFQFVQPFRADSLSLTAAAVRMVGAAVLPVSLAGVALAVALLALTVRRGAGLPLACAAAAAAWCAVLVWNKQAFCNYWWLASGLLGIAATAPAVREKG